ncbi:MAG: hypothetical protein A2Z07_03050 [Armatimonadetes bacterium RBG_16_67_12]|nr:MAG: hypothetical protein A2Z07_03050 [Armatimonadetes bacterium RBG_16_67_12]
MTSNRRARKGKQTRNALILVAVIAVVAAVAVAVVHFRSVTPPPAALPTPADQAAPGGKVWGREGAPVTIEVYSDFL